MYNRNILLVYLYYYFCSLYYSSSYNNIMNKSIKECDVKIVYFKYE